MIGKEIIHVSIINFRRSSEKDLFEMGFCSAYEIYNTATCKLLSLIQKHLSELEVYQKYCILFHPYINVI